MERSNGILSLSHSVLQTILFDLDVARKLELQRVRRRFLDIMPFSKVVLDDLPRHVFESSPLDVLGPLNIFPLDKWLERMRRSATVSVNAARFLYETFREMRTLVLTNCGFEFNLLQFLPSLRALTVRDVQFNSFVDKNKGRTLGVLRNMAWFHVKPGITMPDLKNICSEPLGCFRKLEVKGWDEVQQEDMEWMGIHLPKLRVLGVPRCRLSWISKAFQLKQLAITNASVDVEVLPEAISRYLVRLEIESPQNVTGYGFLKQMKGLKELVIHHSCFGTSDLENLMHFRCLTGIDLSYTDAVTDDLLDILRQCGYPIRTLVADRDTFSDIGFSTPAVVRYLEWATCLEQFSISGHHRVTDQIFSAGGRFPETLTGLGIDRTGCEMEGVLAFRDRRAALKMAGRFVPNIFIDVSFASEAKGVTTYDSFPGFALKNVYEANWRWGINWDTWDDDSDFQLNFDSMFEQ